MLHKFTFKQLILWSLFRDTRKNPLKGYKGKGEGYHNRNSRGRVVGVKHGVGIIILDKYIRDGYKKIN